MDAVAIQRDRIPSLDGIRAIAIVLVITNHIGNDYDFLDPFRLGDLGVRTFFVISGFLITGLLLREMDRTGTIGLKNFYLRRTLRIFPAFYAYMVVMLLLGLLGLNGLTPFGSLPALTYTSNYWIEWAQSGYVTSHTWSLSTEEQFYLIWPFVLALAGRRAGFWVVLAVVAAAPLLRAAIYIHNGGPGGSLSAFHATADHIGMGCLLAFGRDRLHSLGAYRQLMKSRVFVLVPMLIVWAAAQGNHPSVHQTILLFLINVSIALCIDWAVTNSKGAVGRALNWPPIVFIGTISYSLYLWQQPFTHLNSADPHSLFLSAGWQIIVNPIVGLLCAVACATASYFLVERPVLRLRDRMKPQHELALASTRSTVILRKVADEA